MAVTEAEVHAMWKGVVDALETSRVFGDDTLLGKIDAVMQLLEGDYGPQLGTALDSLRARYSEVLASDSDLLGWVLRSYAKAINSNEVNFPRFLAPGGDLYEWFIANNITIRSRGFSLTQPTAGGSNVGTPAVYRLTVDENGYTFENGKPDAKRAEVVKDAFSQGTLHEEEIKLEGSYASRDLLELEIGSGDPELSIPMLHHQNAGKLTNAGWEQVTTSSTVAVGSAQVVSAVTSWDLVSGSWSSITAQTDNVVKRLPGDSPSIALRFTGNVKIRQKLITNLVKLDPTKPVLLGVWMLKEGSTTGNAVLAFENATTGTATQSVTKDISTLTLNTWTFVPIAVGTASWFKNFNTGDLAVSLATTSLATSTISFDSLTLAEGTFFDGSWYWFVGGNTPAKKGDYWTWTDTEGGTGKIQRWTVRPFGRSLPHTANATQVTAAGGRTLTFANSGSADTITASSGSFVSDGYKAGMIVTIAGTTSNNVTTGKLASVSATVLTFGADTTLANEGPLSATATLNATPTITDPA